MGHSHSTVLSSTKKVEMRCSNQGSRPPLEQRSAGCMTAQRQCPCGPTSGCRPGAICSRCRTTHSCPAVSPDAPAPPIRGTRQDMGQGIEALSLPRREAICHAKQKLRAAASYAHGGPGTLCRRRSVPGWRQKSRQAAKSRQHVGGADHTAPVQVGNGFQQLSQC